MKLEPGQPLYVKDILGLEDFDRLKETRPESAAHRILELNHSSSVGIFSMEDVLMDQEGADPDSRPLAGLAKDEVLTRYKNFNKFAVVMDHADHFFWANPEMNQLPENLAGKINEELWNSYLVCCRYLSM
uniref:uncharacterized protein LOC122603024 n=1 Tax=Erigeron canadensis TaxID=72917 RepID=UPI001CB98BFE|nr:uncharacterized protein LOC122603024 [Erigeron canadensis]